MNRCCRSAFLRASLLLGLVLSVQSAEFRIPPHVLTVPDGFEVELVAGSPLVDRPVNADFDEEGRLYVTESSGTNDKIEKQLQDKPHRIVRLEDKDGDGRFDQSTVFADKMMFPEGCMWWRGSLYVSAPPSIWKLTDTDDDGVADRREEWFQGATLTGCANDLHGPYRGPDGWIYWCKGAFAKQTYERSGKPPFVTRAAHIFRARADGSGIEPVLTGGMDNPVSVAFTPGGERILTGTFFVHPGGGQRDGLIHAIYGGVYGKDHDVLAEHKRTGDLMPIMTHQGPSASCFVMRYESGAFGAEYRDNLFNCLFNLQRVTRHVLIPDGATFRTRDEDFLVSDNPDFHPTDVLEDADGSLLIVDTGGWYKLCCPTSQLWKPDVLGAIYRVRKVGAEKHADPRGLQIDWQQTGPDALTKFLADPRAAVRRRAAEQLAERQAAAVPALEAALLTSADPAVRRNAVWTLTRIEGASSRATVRRALNDTDDDVRQAAVHSVGLWRDREALSAMLAFLNSAPSPLKRAAAEALGRIGDKQAVPALLAATSIQHDRVLEHSLIYALIEIEDAAGVQRFLDSPDRTAFAQRAALIALDQMEGGGLRPERLAPLLASSHPVLRETASWIVGRHPEWAGALVGSFRDRLGAVELRSADRAQLEQQLGEFARDPAIQSLLAEVLSDSARPQMSRQSALRAMAKAGLKSTPPAWIQTVARVLGGNDPALVATAVSTSRALNLDQEAVDLLSALQAVAKDAKQPIEVRLEAMASLPSQASRVESEAFKFVLANLEPAKPVMTRNTAARILARAALSPDQLHALADCLRTAGPLEIPTLLGAFEKTRDEELGLRLIAALKVSPGLAGLQPDTLKSRLTNFPTIVQQQGEELLALLNVDAAQQKAHLDALMGSLSGGDVRRGQVVFNSQKAACATCHAIGYLGGNIGPDLTRIGQIRTERDLIEAIVYPSASFVRSYEPVLVTTKSGDDYSGVVRKDSPDELLLATGPGAEVRLSRSDITEMRPGTVSVMPGGLEEQLSRQELADLIAFLKATRW